MNGDSVFNGPILGSRVDGELEGQGTGRSCQQVFFRKIGRRVGENMGDVDGLMGNGTPGEERGLDVGRIKESPYELSQYEFSARTPGGLGGGNKSCDLKGNGQECKSFFLME